MTFLLPSDVLLSQGSPQLPSALKSLTSVFGMGTGVTSLPSSLDIYLFERIILSKLDKRYIECFKHIG